MKKVFKNIAWAIRHPKFASHWRRYNQPYPYINETQKIPRIIWTASIACLMVSFSLAFTGCLTKKVVTPGSVTASGAVIGPVTNTVVNEENLAIDSAVLQSVVATATALAVQRDPSVVQPLKTAHLAMDNIVNGVSQESVQDVLGKLKAQNNPTVAAQVDSLMKSASALEQKLIAKYGQSVAGEISIALVKAADAGIIVGLTGH